jgi:hypothetical protein
MSGGVLLDRVGVLVVLALVLLSPVLYDVAGTFAP